MKTISINLIAMKTQNTMRRQWSRAKSVVGSRWAFWTGTSIRVWLSIDGTTQIIFICGSFYYNLEWLLLDYFYGLEKQISSQRHLTRKQRQIGEINSEMSQNFASDIRIIIIQMSLIEKIKKTLSDPKQLSVLLAGVGLLAVYTLYSRKQIFTSTVKDKNKRSSLDLSLNELIKDEKKPNIFKIVITESSPISVDFKRMIVTRLKEFLQGQGLNTLVNCAPLKLFHAGTEVFVNTLIPEDPEDEIEYMSYFQNAIKCQLIIEKTIVDIDQIKNSQKNTFILCDTNSLDIRASNDLTLWNKFVRAHQINERDLRDNYKYVFHVEAFGAKVPADLLEKHFKGYEDNDEEMDRKITEAWRGFKNYYIVQYKPFMMMEENVELALEQIVERMKPILPPGTSYTKRRVFTKEW